MKKSILYLMIMVLSLNIFPIQMTATEKDPVPVSNDPKEMPAEVKTMLARLDEIKAMDKSSLKPSEKKALRKEVKDIKTHLKTAGHGVYLSVAAIIIIILLLILLI
jgi:uncharacterized MAPEG superfamily protein